MEHPELSFDADFESGNILSTERVDELEYNIFMRPDCGIHVRLWFYFRVTNMQPNATYIFNIVAFSKHRTTFFTGQTPVVRSATRSKWEKIPKQQCYYYMSPKHKCYTSNPILSFVFQFDRAEDHFFAFCYPFTHSMLSQFLTRLSDHRVSFLRIVTLGHTKMGRDLSVVLINKDINTLIGATVLPHRSTTLGINPYKTTKRLVMITARVHPGETPSSYVMHGILEFITSNSPAAKFLRDRIVFVLVPMINIDGVVEGCYRSSMAGVDLNRCYYEPQPANHPEVHMIRSFFIRLVQCGNRISPETDQLARPCSTPTAPSKLSASGLPLANHFDSVPEVLSEQSLDLPYLRTHVSAANTDPDSMDALSLDGGFRINPLHQMLLSNAIDLDIYHPPIQGNSSLLAAFSEAPIASHDECAFVANELPCSENSVSGIDDPTSSSSAKDTNSQIRNIRKCKSAKYSLAGGTIPGNGTSMSSLSKRDAAPTPPLPRTQKPAGRARCVSDNAHRRNVGSPDTGEGAIPSTSTGATTPTDQSTVASHSHMYISDTSVSVIANKGILGSPSPSYDALYQLPSELEALLSNRLPLDMVIDLHSHSNLSGGFLFVNPDAYVFNRERRMACELVFPYLLAQQCSTFGSLNESFKSSKNKREGSLRRALMNIGKDIALDNAPYIYCIEVSNSHGPDPKQEGKLSNLVLTYESDASENESDADDALGTDNILYTPESWLVIGEKVVMTLHALYQNLKW